MLTRALKQSFVDAIRRMLRPMVRQLVAWGVPYPAFDQIVREVFVEVAEEDFALPTKQPTDSRVALVTGINRKEISRLRGLRRQPDRTPPLEDAMATRVIGRWLAGPPYADTRGRPRPLLYEAPPSRPGTFSRLVRDLALDVPVRSVLDELVRAGCVERDAEDRLVLVREAHVPAGDPEAKLSMLGSDPAEVFSTIVHNVESPDEPWLQRKVIYDNVGGDSLAELRTAAQELGGELLRRGNALIAAHDRDRNPEAPGGARTRVVLGVYWNEVSAPPSEPRVAAPDTPKRRRAAVAGSTDVIPKTRSS